MTASPTSPSAALPFSTPGGIRRVAALFVIFLFLAFGSTASRIGAFHNPFMAVARADDDTGDDNSDDSNMTGPTAPGQANNGGGNGGGAVLSEDVQWQMAMNSYNKREYDDSAILCLSYAEANPDGPHAIEALWYAYSIYRNNRPDTDKRNDTRDKLMAAANKWITKYATSDKEKGGNAEWYLANLYENEGQHDSSIAAYEQLVKRFPGTQFEQNAWWQLGEWAHGAKEWTDAIKYYEGYRKCVGITEWGGVSVFREADCYEQLKDLTDAISTYQIVFDPKYNWGWWQLANGALDASHRLMLDGAPEISRKMAMMIIDHSPTDGGWSDVQNQARALLGEAPALKILIQPQMHDVYETPNIDIDGGSKLTVTHNPNVWVRVSYATKDKPFSGTLTIAPKVDMATIPDGLTKVEGDKGTSYTVLIQSPDKNGNAIGDLNYVFKQSDVQESAPHDLVVTRKWEKAGADWGNCTIRIQSSANWDVQVYLPNNQTNPNNVNIQPNENDDGGTRFHWYAWYDMSQGWTIKFPIQVGTNVTEYYPKVRLEQNFGRFGDQSMTGSDAKYSVPEYNVDLKSDQPFPCTYSFPVNDVIWMDEISK